MLGIFLDSETNGLNPKKHRIVEIAFHIVDMVTGENKETFNTLIALSPEEWKLSDPASLRVNGFKWDELVGAPSAEEVGENIAALFARHGIQRGKAVFICQNPSFDRVFFAQLIDVDRQEKLLWPYHWLDLASMFWARSFLIDKAFPWTRGYTKDKIALAMKLPIEGLPHRALNGTDHLLLCYRSVVGFLNN